MHTHHLGGAGRGDLVEAIGASNHQSIGTAQPEDVRHGLGQILERTADEVATWAHRIGERTEHIEYRRNTDLASGLSRVAERRVKNRGEAEGDSQIIKRTSDVLRTDIYRHPESLENICAARLRARRPVSVFGNLDARAGDDERGHRRDIDRALPVTPGSDNVDAIGTGAGRNIDREVDHDVGEARELLGRYAFCLDRHAECRDLGIRRGPAHDFAHCPRCAFTPDIGARYEEAENIPPRVSLIRRVLRRGSHTCLHLDRECGPSNQAGM